MKRLWLSLGRLFPPERRRHALAMLVVLVVAFAIRARNIQGSLPYCLHVDESTWSSIALRILRTGDANPHRFRKPSLPVYLMTAGFSVGLVHAQLSGQARHAVDLGLETTPYYRVPSAALPPKLLFALASVLALGLAGWVGAALTGRVALLWLTPLVASVSSSYLRLSWSYMDVDVIGTFFIWTTLAYLVRARVRGLSLTSGPGWLPRFLTLGALAGLAVGSKYNLFPILVPCVLYLVLFERATWLRRSVLLGAVAVAVFFATTPFALVTPGEFIADVLKEARHYATGHNHVAIPRGLLLWKHVAHFADNFGVLPLFLSLVGVALCFRHDARLSLVVFSYAVVFVAYMSLQHVFFERNVMALHLLVALALALAVLELPGVLAAAALARWPRLSGSRPRALSFALVLGLTLFGLPWSRVANAYSTDSDTRNRATVWLARKLRKKTLVIIDSQLQMDSRPLRKLARVKTLDAVKEAARVQALAGAKHLFVVTLVGDRAAFESALGGLRQRAQFGSKLQPNEPGSPSLVILGR